MSKHTAGPWHVEPEEWTEGRGLLIVAQAGPVALIDPEDAASDEDQANARLIAAAPELLEALQMFLAALESIDFSAMPGVYDAIPFALAETAIAKATGEDEPAQDIAESETCPEGYECPTCGENRTDALIWTSEEDVLICETCGTMYAVEAAKPADEREESEEEESHSLGCWCDRCKGRPSEDDDESERTQHCGKCHACGSALRKVLDGEEWCDTCGVYRRYQSHGWGMRGEGGDWYCPKV